MYCIRCGKQLADGTKYCIYCGAPTAVPEKPKEVSPEDDFTIAVPKDYVQSDASGMDATQHISFGQDFMPDPAEEYMPKGLQDEISQVIDEEWGERKQAAAHEEKAEDVDEDSTLLRQYVQDVMSSENTHQPEQAESAPEQPVLTQEDTRAFAADIQ
uniref:zinc ribbon domain-containing protein n=1 Tax=Butyricicoccus sp. TaxID=2049021 RepID=UPI003D7D6533